MAYKPPWFFSSESLYKPFPQGLYMAYKPPWFFSSESLYKPFPKGFTWHTNHHGIFIIVKP
jgi:hypothetical protein